MNPDIKAEMRMFYDGDPWGWAMGWLFAIARAVNGETGETPEHWQYRPSPLEKWPPLRDEDCFPDSEVWAWVDNGWFSIQEIEDAGEVLHRYTAMLRRAGADY
jgi:hypothetical protein